MLPIPDKTISVTANTDISSAATITYKTGDGIATINCRFTAKKKIAANVFAEIATFTGGTPARGNMVVPAIIMTSSTVPLGDGMILIGAGVMLLISDTEIQSGYIIQGSGVYIS